MKEPIEILRVDSVNHHHTGVEVVPILSSTAFGNDSRNLLSHIRHSWAFDRYSSDACGWVHVNMGVAPHLLVSTVREGERLLSPLVEPKQWPSSSVDVQVFLCKVLFAMVDDARFPEGTMLKLYTPFINRAGDSKWFEQMARDVLSELQASEPYLRRNLVLEVFRSGVSVEIGEG